MKVEKIFSLKRKTESRENAVSCKKEHRAKLCKNGAYYYYIHWNRLHDIQFTADTYKANTTAGPKLSLVVLEQYFTGTAFYGHHDFV